MVKAEGGHMCCDADSSRWQPVLYQLFIEIGVDVRTMYIVHTLHYIEDWGGMCDHVLMMLGVAGGSGPVSTGSNIIICI